MSVESVADRARLHAALGDPARLRIVDTLTVGDASPSELAALLSMPSNLVAHHLKILRREGVVERTASEGDGRRSYLRLVPGALTVLNHLPQRAAGRVLFVCTANSARSHLAAGLWRRRSPVPAASAGTHPADGIAPGAIAAAQRHRLPLPRVRPRHVDEVRGAGDLVITVCDRAHEELTTGTDAHWSVPDPVAVGTPEAFDAALTELTHRVERLAHLVVPAPPRVVPAPTKETPHG